MTLECKSPGCLRPVRAKGFCVRHYEEQWALQRPRCSHEGCEKFQHAMGLCNLHYRQKHRAEGARCAVKDCGRPTQAHGMCSTHYRRQKLYGSLDPTRPEDWGSREKHPLSHSWHWLLRTKNENLICDEWRKDFWKFVHDMGPRPERHILDRKDKTAPHGPDNSFWRAPIMGDFAAESRRDYMREYAKRSREQKPQLYRKMHFKKHHGITLETYAAMNAAQGGRCAICKRKEITRHRTTGKPVNLAVDHCHVTGKIRGLLCTKCNTALGAMDDDISRLEAAIAYLKRHAGL